MRSLGIKNLRNLSEAGLGQMRFKTIQKSFRLRAGFGVPAETLDPGGHQRTQKKWPDCALMIGVVSFQYASFIAGTIAWIVRCQCAKSYRSHELFLHEPEDVLCTIAWDEVIAQGDGVELIGPQADFVAIRSVDDVIQVAAMFVSEPLLLDGEFDLSIPFWNMTIVAGMEGLYAKEIGVEPPGDGPCFDRRFRQKPSILVMRRVVVAPAELRPDAENRSQLLLAK